MSDADTLPYVVMPCLSFPCTNKHRPKPLTHRWVPILIREAAYNHYSESRSMTIADLKLILAALTPEQRTMLLSEVAKP